MPRLYKHAVVCIFLASGFAGLVYQTLWVRALSLSVGSTSVALSFVLSVFFGGLALGSYVAARFANRLERPLAVYAYTEIAIGLYAALVIHLLFAGPTLLAKVAAVPVVGGFFVYFFVAAALLPPTVAMGATLPLLVRLCVRSESRLGWGVSVLYGFNTLGAVVGAFASGFLLVPAFGVVGANYAAALVNVLVGLVALALGRSKTAADWAVRPRLDSPFAFSFTRGIALTRFQKGALLASAAVGFASIALEVVWSKYLGIFLGTNIFGLSLVLTVVLLGIAVGSLVLAPVVDRFERREPLFLMLLGGAIAALLGATRALNFAPVLANLIAYYVGGWISMLWVKACIAALILILPTSLLGALLPLAMRILGGRPKDAPEVVGVLYSLNTLGAILGAFAGGILITPHFGSSATIMIALAILALSGLVLALTWRAATLPRAAAALLFVCGLLVAARSPQVDFRHIIQSAYQQYTDENLTLAEAVRHFAEDAEEFEKIIEGESAVISLSYEKGEKDYLWLKTNGLRESYFDVDGAPALPKYEGLLAFLPYALEPDAKRAFVVGYGGGYTVDFLVNMGIPYVHVAEIEPAILKAADHVYRGKNPLLKKPNLQLEFEDARRLLAREREPYDIIISQPSHSWLSGVANLFTREFFELVKSRLASRGVFAQWLNLYNTDVETLRSLMRTFFAVFPHGAVFTDVHDSEMILIGSPAETRFSLVTLGTLALDPRVREDLAEIPFEDAFDIFPQFLITRQDALAAAGTAPINSDRNAYAEVRQSRLFYENQANQASEWLNQLYDGAFTGLVEAIDMPMSDFYARVIGALQKRSNNFFKFHKLFGRLENTLKNSPSDLLLLGNLSYRMERYSSAISYLERSLAAAPSAHALNALLGAYLAVNRFDDADRVFAAHPRFRDRVTDCYELDLRLARRSPAAGAVALKIHRDYERYRELCGVYLERLLGIFHFHEHRYRQALTHFESYYEEYPNDLDVIGKMISAYLITGERETAQTYMDLYPSVQEEETRRLEQVAEFYRAQGLGGDADSLAKKAESISGAKLKL